MDKAVWTTEQWGVVWLVNQGPGVKNMEESTPGIVGTRHAMALRKVCEVHSCHSVSTPEEVAPICEVSDLSS